MFNDAEKMLERDGVIVIKGAQGEGKTTIAKKLVKNKDKCLKINSFTDWDMYSRETVETVLIDDMFGCTMFDKSESRKLLKIFPHMMSLVSQKEIKLIITSRSYILDDAQKKLYISHHIKESNMLEISSKKLNDEEKKEIVKSHMNMNNREEDETLIDDCVKQSNIPSSFIIGFPECARLFCVQDSLFLKKGAFFERPMTHVKSCLVSVFKEKYTFLAFFVVWAQKSQKVCLLDLEQRPDKTPNAIKYPIENLGYSLHDTLKEIRDILSNNKDFIDYDSKTETCQFQHRVLGDAVGLVAFEKNKTAVLEYCDASFIERYVSIEGKTITEYWNGITVTIIPKRFEQLCSKIGHLIFPQNEGNKDDQYLNCTILLHPAFEEKAFCDTFIETMRKRKILHELLTKSVGTVGARLLSIQSILDRETFNTEIGILVYALNNSRTTFALTCFSEMKSNDFYKKRLESDLKMSMLLAVSEGDVNKIEDLDTKMEGQTIDCNIILSSIKYANVRVLDLILDISKMSINQYTKEGMSPLMIFVEEKDSNAVKCILNSNHFSNLVIDYKNEKDGKTALHIACALGNADIVKMLLAKNPTLQIRDRNQECPIHSAALNGKVEIVKLLLDHDNKQADITIDFKGMKSMPLYHIAVRKQDEKLLNLLLKRKHSVMCVNGNNQTPLALALQDQKFDIIKALTEISIKEKAHTKVDNKGQTALHIATEKLLALPNDDKRMNDWYGIVEQLSKGDVDAVSNETENIPLQMLLSKRKYFQEKLDRLDDMIKRSKKDD